MPAIAQLPKIERGRPEVRAEAVLSDVLSRDQGIFIGEMHEGRNPARRLLIETLPLLKARNVATIGLEAFASEDQDLIDAYVANPTEETRRTLHAACLWDEPEWIDIIDAIRSARGIRLVGVDTKERRTNPLPRDEVDRRWARALRQAHQEAPRGSKYVLFGGLLHSSTGTPFRGAPGIDEILNISSIIPANPNEFTDRYFALEGGYKIIDRAQNVYHALEVTSFKDFCAEHAAAYEKLRRIERRDAYRVLGEVVASIMHGSVSAEEKVRGIAAAQSMLPGFGIDEQEGLRQLLATLNAL
jgi:hypothetical protein